MTRVLILGATSAIASDVARVYAGRSARLWLLGRDADKLARLRDELGSAAAGHEVADFTHCTRNAALVERAIAGLGGLDVALIAHGLLGDQQASEHDFAEAECVIRTNFTSAVSLIIPLANHFEAQGRGRLAVISSVAGERGRPRNYTYGAAKSALTTYLQGVRSRLWPDVHVLTVKLGPVDTPMTVDHPKNPLFTTSGAAARDIVAAIDAGGGEAYVPWYWRPIMGAVRQLPETVFQRFGFLSGR